MPANSFNGQTDYGIGIGLRVPHYAHILAQKPVVDWFEIISENFMVDGGRPLEILERILEQYQVVQHGVSMYFGSADKPDRAHLRKLKNLVKRTKTPWLSDHLCWGSVDGTFTHDLLPVPYTFAAARRTAEKIRQVRDFVGVPICVENVSSYAEYHASEMTEWEFLSEVVELADCGILLDVNNIYVSSKNHGFDPYAYVNNIPHHRVGQMHVAGHTRFEKYVLDTHDHPVLDPVWKLYAHATRLCGVTATLLEWDDKIPSFDEVHNEALKANAFIDGGEAGRAMTAFGLKPAPRRAPVKIASTEDLRALQRLMTHALVRPLTKNDGLQPTWIDGRPTAEVAAEFIKPNDRLSSFDRLEIYSRMYWFRLLDGVRDDCPGLRALLGERAFDRLAQAYLARYPSRSFTMRNLCSRLEQFIGEEPALTAPRTALAREIARFEWSQTVAFDGPAKPRVKPAQLAATPPERLCLGLQPYLTLLVLEHPLDDWVIAVKRRSALRGEASQAPTAGATRRPRRHAAPRRGRIRLAVHRHDLQLYYKRLEPAAYRILASLRAGAPLAEALAAAGPRVPAAKIQAWFTSWMALGWFCRWEKPAASPL